MVCFELNPNVEMVLNLSEALFAFIQFSFDCQDVNFKFIIFYVYLYVFIYIYYYYLCLYFTVPWDVWISL